MCNTLCLFEELKKCAGTTPFTTTVSIACLQLDHLSFLRRLFWELALEVVQNEAPLTLEVAFASECLSLFHVEILTHYEFNNIYIIYKIKYINQIPFPQKLVFSSVKTVCRAAAAPAVIYHVTFPLPVPCSQFVKKKCTFQDWGEEFHQQGFKEIRRIT